MQQLKTKKKWLPALIVAVLVGVLVILAIMFVFFQRQEVFDKYDVAYEIDGKLYEVFPISTTDIGVDKKSDDKHFFFRVNSYYNIDYLFRLAYKQYEINEPSTNKYYSGLIDYSVADNAYVTQKDIYMTKDESYATYDFFDKTGKKIYTYNPEETSTDDYIVRIKPTILQGYKKSDIGSYDDYLDITALFKDKLGMDVKVRIDDDKKMVIFSIK
ncbi:hypothetical protein C1903_03050 [Listeria ivanovii]|uniref:hypothetical protein n=1 Tax=Listeria ivanovii TaxID=1638 RepID=UPI000DA9F5C7|nr:hypothetical protein [Listeria ivanovii]PZF90542.1 hypothetical protein C1905_03120 [Listeria ivanovii]PZF95928.1 hypothetical protein C1903_03050 [Listeria ivanovii]PZG06178.1 hypothetical protein C2L88_03045 [Listeria ivanovii]PZG11039.1 hypothetical protein C1901_03080 [Listeria ivanovii]PZG28066.1 hypothetical protein C1900_03125 [Listeria ivanovii]